ncbi:hypothetical protein [uncultured Chryseobacterium sp.]|uniref:hypothetical protein n=1 Tax=uncultured Chryseobacterium sp. TaxID=259322 RepID=UPI0025F4C6E6|nr:hypothetical protein [uncultured Chryseobacterium sp.]
MEKLLMTTFFTVSIWSSAQGIQKEYEVKPYMFYLSEYKSYYEMVYSQVESNPDLSLAEKLKRLNEEISKLKNKFRKVRKTEFESKSTELSVSHSCTKENSGGIKDCGYKYVSAPSPAFYTTKEWISVEGDNKGAVVSGDGSSAGLKMTIAGKGTNTGVLYAVYKYRPNYIEVTVKEDTDKLFDKVIQ